MRDAVQPAPRFTTGTSKTRGSEGGEVVKSIICTEKGRVSPAASTANGSSRSNSSSRRRTSQYDRSLEENHSEAPELSPISKKVPWDPSSLRKNRIR